MVHYGICSCCGSATGVLSLTLQQNHNPSRQENRCSNCVPDHLLKYFEVKEMNVFPQNYEIIANGLALAELSKNIPTIMERCERWENHREVKLYPLPRKDNGFWECMIILKNTNTQHQFTMCCVQRTPESKLEFHS